MNNEIIKLHEHVHRIVYNNYVWFFQELLNKDNSFTIHHQNIRSLVTAIFKTLSDLLREAFEGLFTNKIDSYSIRLKQKLTVLKVNTVLNWKICAIMWNSIPNDVKNTAS